MATATMTKTQIEARIKDLEATPRALVGCDEGTHGTPLNHRIYEEITGERYATAQFAGSNWTRCTEESAQADTNGRIRVFVESLKGMRAAQRELRELRKQVRSL